MLIRCSGGFNFQTKTKELKTQFFVKRAVFLLKKTEVINNLYRSNVAEEKLETLKDDGKTWHITVKPYEILTLGTEKC